MKFEPRRRLFAHYLVAALIGLYLANNESDSIGQQVQLGPDGPVVLPEEEDHQAEPVVHRHPANEPRQSTIRVAPAPEPSPALKYSLVPDYRDLKAGNAAPYYYRAIMRLNGTKRSRGRPVRA